MNIPKHIVLFPDGNRRWAKQKGMPSLKGHEQGYNNLIDFAILCKEKGIKVLTAFGFSTENWNRSPEEVNYLMILLEKGLLESLEKFKQNGTRVKIIGQKERLPESLKLAIEKIENQTQANQDLVLNLAISYGGKWDILQAVQKIIDQKIPAQEITETSFAQFLSTAGQPEPDFIIRAGGEMRLSNFVLWQAAYAELYFSPKFWPDFSKEDLEIALTEFDRRARRFGH